MKRSRLAAAVAIALLGIACLAGLAGCPSNAAPSLYTPITGMIIDSSQLLEGIGCGTAPDQVYMYAAVVTLANDGGAQPSGLPVSGVFDCFTNAELSNLPTLDGGTTTYDVVIYAFNQQTFPSQALGGCFYLPSDAACQGEDPMAVEKFATIANWKTTCTATQVPGVSEVAVCNPLVSTEDASFGPDEGAEASEGEGGPDATIEAGDASASGGDGGDGASGDGGEGGSGDGATSTDSGTPDGGAEAGSVTDSGSD